jgi:hypothetical protein
MKYEAGTCCAGFSANKELKDLGQGFANITNWIDGLEETESVFGASVSALMRCLSWTIRGGFRSLVSSANRKDRRNVL